MLTDINRGSWPTAARGKITRKPQRHGLCGYGTAGLEWNGASLWEQGDWPHLRDWRWVQGRNTMSVVTEIVNR